MCWHLLLVPLSWILWQILISYCKFIMPKALKWGILHICTLVIYQDIPENQIQVTIFLSGTDVRWEYNHLCIAFFKLKYLGRIVFQLCIDFLFFINFNDGISHQKAFFFVADRSDFVRCSYSFIFLMDRKFEKPTPNGYVSACSFR